MRRLLPILVLLLGCSKSSDVSIYKVPKEAPKGAPQGLPPNHPGMGGAPGGGMGGGMTASASDAPASTGLDWKDPAGWKREAGSGFRVATYHLGGDAECSVISLGGAAGGDLANVNRWRGQLGQGNVTSLDGLSSSVSTPVGKALVVAFDGDGEHKGKRLVGAIVFVDDVSWFFKLTGPKGAVEQAKPGLLKLLGSLRRA